MLFYWGIWSVFIILALLWKDKYYKLSYIVLTLLVFILAVIAGGREYVGADWESYQTYYETGYAYDKATGRMEPLFELIRQICFGLGFSYGFFCFTCCLLSLLVLCAAFKRLGVRNCFLAFSVYLSLFFCNYQFNIIRHGILASFILLSFAFLSKGMRWKSLLCVLVGSGFHVMGLVFVPFVLFIDKSLSKKAAIIIVAVSFIVYLVGLSGKIVAAFPVLSAVDRLAGYVDPDKDDVYKLSIGIIGFVCIAIYSILCMRREYEKEASFRIMNNMLVCGFIVFCLLNGFSALVQRIGNLMNLGVIIVLPHILYHSRGSKRLVVLLLVTVYLALYYPRTWNVADERGNYTMLPFKTSVNNLF